MIEVKYATLENGQKIEYVVTENPPHGGMKHTYFTPDKSQVVQFFNDSRVGHSDEVQARIKAILSKYNPTLEDTKGGAIGNNTEGAKYFKNRFCWPLAIIVKPEFGILCPAYPNNFFFNNNSSLKIDLNGKDKKSNWFTTKNRKYLSKVELGNFKNMFNICILLSRTIRRMHQAGLAHSDLSNNNVLIDPKNGDCVVIDIDSLVVPGIFPPDVIGTRGYIAPEVLSALMLPHNHPNRKYPSTYTDLHALPVLLYEYLLFRHPLMGPKIYSTNSSEEDDFLSLGPMATFIENPIDLSNRPQNLDYKIKDFGSILENLFLKAFVDGLHSPNERPTAMDWERGLSKTWDLLHPCNNKYCEQKWFVLYDLNKAVCPFCNTKVSTKEIIRFKFKKESINRKGQWLNVSELNIINNTDLLPWHVYNNIFPDEKADKTVQASIVKNNENWFLVNNNILGMLSPKGTLVPIGERILLKDNMVFKISKEANSMLVEVVIKKIV